MPIDLAIDLLEVAAIGLVGWQLRSVRAASAKGAARYDQMKRLYEKAQAASAKGAARYDQMKRLYEKAQRNLNEHIRSPIHK